MWRKRGYSLHGIKPHIYRPVKRSQRYSILPAYTSSGILAYTIQQGSITGEKFRRFLKYKVLPRCNRFPGPRSVLLMDNCSTHYGVALRELCRRRGVIILYLPPYSPDYNPIEEFFSVLKAWLKRHHEVSDHCSFPDFLDHAVEACSTGRDAKRHFRRAGISIGDGENGDVEGEDVEREEQEDFDEDDDGDYDIEY